MRAGLQALPVGQFEAADSLGLGYWRKMRLVILRRRSRRSFPPLVSNLIGMFKNTSLVSIISLFDLLETAKQSLVDPNWRGSHERGLSLHLRDLFCRLLQHVAL